MKKKMLKAVCFVMSVIMLLISMSVGSFAADKEMVYLSSFVGYSVYDIYENEAGTIALINFYNPDLDDTKYVYSKNGTDYTTLNFDSFVQEHNQEMDYYSVDDICVKGNEFVFLVNLYVFGDYNYDIQDYSIDIIATYFLSTEDFDAFEKYEFQGLTGDDMYYSPTEYAYRGLFDYVDGKWVYANTDFKVTYVSEQGVNGREIYYISDDLVNWEPCYLDDETLYYEDTYYSDYFSVVGDFIVVNRVVFVDDPNVYAYVQRTYVIESFHNWATVYNIRYSYDITESIYFAPTDTEDYIYAFELVYEDALNIGYQTAYSQLVKIDLTTTQRTVLSKTDKDYSLYSGAGLGDTNYLISNDLENNSMSVSYLKNDGTLKPITFDGSENIEGCYAVGERVYAFENNSMWILEDTDARKYDVADIINREGIINVVPFMLNNNIYLILTLEDGSTEIYDTQIEHGKLGDINLDSKFASSDALLALKFSTGTVALDDNAAYRADVNKDGNINSTDALMILNRTTGLLEQF